MSLTVPVVSGVELCNATCSAVPTQVCKPIGNGWKMGCSSTLKAEVGGWGLTSCLHPPGELQHGHHGPKHILPWPSEPRLSVSGPIS